MGRFLRQLAAVGLAAAALLASAPARSQFTSDLDIFSATPTGADIPNVLIVVDNGANWQFAETKAAFRSVFSSLPLDKFRVGMMMFTQNNPPGGFVWAGIRPVDAAHRDRLVNLVDSWSIEPASNGGHKTNQSNVNPSLAMAEAWHYFAGRAPIVGNAAETKTDFAGNENRNAKPAEIAIYRTPGNALASASASAYNNAFAVGNCAPNYVIFLSNGPAGDLNEHRDEKTGSAWRRLKDAHAEAGLAPPTVLPISPNKQQGNLADEWALFMKQSPQRIITYTIDVAKAAQAAEWTPVLRSMATHSGGGYFQAGGDVGASIETALRDILNQIQAVNTVFASASLPVSASARGTHLNQVFMGMFRPDSDGRPRWRGNLKQYRFGYDPATDTLSLVDAQGRSAVSGATGFISPEATSIWTRASDFWRNQPLGSPPSPSDAPDGEVVEKGGVAQQIREAHATTQAGRRLFTCTACAAGTQLATDTGARLDNVSAAALGVLTETERVTLLDWVRGRDNALDERGPGGNTTIRPSVHGDVLHSRPVVVNYGGTTGVVVFYGANDGFLRAVNGNPSGPGAGGELWGFVPGEHLGKLKRLRSNYPLIRLSTTVMPDPADELFSPRPRDYFVDGPIGVYQKVNAAGVSEKVWIYSAMRRGGRQLYALEVTDPNQPVFRWKHTEASLPVLGQTWSEPKVARLRGHPNPVIVMGAGYDNEAEDQSPPGATRMGHAVLVLDAFDGTLLRQFDTSRSVAADVALIDADHDGFVDRAYAVDLGGTVYRIDFETATSQARERWSSRPLATLGTEGAERPRKFFFPPDVVLTRDHAALLLASGDREKPLDTVSNDRFFTLYDRQLGKGGSEPPPALRADDLGRIGASDANFQNGCYMSLDGAGEKAVNAPVTAAGITYFSTNKPLPRSTNACVANLGQARVYSVPLFCRAATSQVLAGGGLPPSPVVGVVSVSYVSQESGKTVSKEVPFIIGAANPKNSGIEGSKVKPAIAPVRKRKFWYLENAR